MNLFFYSQRLLCERIGLVKLHCDKPKELEAESYPGIVGFSTSGVYGYAGQTKPARISGHLSRGRRSGQWGLTIPTAVDPGDIVRYAMIIFFRMA